jgi:hypothetical protein
VIELGSQGSTYIVELAQGEKKYFVDNEMRSCCEAHNKLLDSDNDIIVQKVQEELQAVSTPGFEYRRHELPPGEGVSGSDRDVVTKGGHAPIPSDHTEQPQAQAAETQRQ